MRTSRLIRCASALYHNNGDGTFTDVTDKAGVGGEGHYGQGVAVGDFNNDGYPTICHRLRPSNPLSQQRQRNVHRCDGKGRGRG